MTIVEEVAIIGAGLSGLALALSLHQQSIPCTVYDTRPAPLDIGGAIILSPNSLRILDALDVYDSIKRHGHQSETVVFRTQDDRLVDSYEIGNESKYGYKALRVYRKAVVTELVTALSERGIPIQWGKKFVRILSESENEVTWEFGDGSIGRAGSLVGADGIYSRVRGYLHPDVKPHFMNIVAVAAVIPTSQVVVPEGYHLPVTIMSKDQSAFIIAPQKPDGSELMLGRQMRSVEHDREGWDALIADKRWCVDFLRRGADEFPEIIRMGVQDIDMEKINVWPFNMVPELGSWTSERGRVTILGDAAHGIPPSSGQGANQVFEDAYTYALIRGQCRGFLGDVLAKWKRGRQERIDRLIVFAKKMNTRRLPGASADGSDDAKSQGSVYFDTEWVFKPDFKQMVQGWLDS